MKLDWPSIGTWIILHKRIIAIVFACIAGLGLLLWFFDAAGSWNFNRGQNARKEAVNTALQEISNVQANIAKEKQTEAALIANVKRDSADHLSAINATDAQREATDRAISRMETAANSNQNVTAEQLEKIMEGLK